MRFLFCLGLYTGLSISLLTLAQAVFASDKNIVPAATTAMADDKADQEKRFKEAIELYKKKNYSGTLQLLRPLADQGYAPAQFNIGFMYDVGEGVAKSDQEARKWYLRAADQGDIYAQFNLALLHLTGRGVPQNDQEALKWYRKAAEGGHDEAQRSLGVLYRSGRAVPRDDQEAFKWFRRAADQGNPSAHQNLGVMYITGQGVARDPKEALRLFRFAAERGEPNAQLNLGMMHENGDGVPRDYKEAAKWYYWSAQQKNARAKSQLDALINSGNVDPPEKARAAQQAAAQAVACESATQGYELQACAKTMKTKERILYTSWINARLNFLEQAGMMETIAEGLAYSQNDSARRNMALALAKWHCSDKQPANAKRAPKWRNLFEYSAGLQRECGGYVPGSLQASQCGCLYNGGSLSGDGRCICKGHDEYGQCIGEVNHQAVAQRINYDSCVESAYQKGLKFRP